MKYADVVEEKKTSEAIANEMIESARAKRQEQRTAKIAGRIIKTVVAIAVIIWVLILVWPYVTGQAIRDRSRTETVDAVVTALENYRTSHSNNLPQERSRKQWQNEFVKNHLIGKDFMNNPMKADDEEATYTVEVNYKKSNQEILDGKYGVIYIDQSTRCGEENDASETAGSSIASVRLKLESGKIYCKNNG